MKTTLMITIVLFIISLFAFLPHTAAVDTTKRGLPEGAVARLGKGPVREIAYSPDGTRLAVASSIGIWMYDAQTYEERSFTTEENRLWFSPDWRTRVSSKYDAHNNESIISLWDWNTGERLHTLTEHAGQVGSVVFSPDGQTLLIISRGDSNAGPDVYLWDANTGERLHTFTGYTGRSGSAVFSPDGQTLLIYIGRYSNEAPDVYLWDANTGERLHTLTEHTSQIRNAVFSPDGQTLATNGHSDGSIYLWNVEIGILQHTLIADTVRVFDISFSPDGQTLVSSNYDGENVHLWDVKTGTVRQTLTRNRFYTYGIQSVLFSPDGQTLAGAGYNEVPLWNVKTGELLLSLSGHKGWINDVSFSPDGQMLASASSQDGTIRFWDVNTGVHRQTLTGHAPVSFLLSFSPDGQTLASGSGRYIYLWDMNTNTLRQTVNAYTVLLRGISFSPDGQTIACVGQGIGQRNSVWLLDANTGSLLRELRGHKGEINSVSFSPDGQTIASGSVDNTIRLWDMKTGTLRQTLIGHTWSVGTVSFSPDGQTLASGSPPEFYLWDVKTGTFRQIGTGDGDGISGNISFSPDGQTIAGMSYQRRTIRLWDVKTGEYLRTLTGHTGEAYDVVFSPDGQTIASGGSALHFWNANTGRYLRSLTTHNASVNGVVFSPDGQTIASGSAGTVLLWDLNLILGPPGTNDDGRYPNLAAYYPFDSNTEDASGNGNHGQGYGTINYVFGKFGEAIELNNGEYIEMEASDSLHGDLFKTDLFTLSAWIYPKPETSYGHAWRSLPREAGHNTLFIIEEQGIISWRGRIDGAWSWNNLCETDPSVFKADTWIHVAVTNDGDKLRIYVDGEKTAETDFQETDGGNTIYRIGSSSTGGETFAGLIDDYAVFSRALSEDEINSIIQDGVEAFLTGIQVVDDRMDIPEDINNDGTVNIQDLVAVAAALGETGENDADVNADGKVDIQDLVAVAAALGEVAAAPSAIRHQAAEQLTSTDVQHWLMQARHANLTDPNSQRGMRFLEQLLSALIPKETALLPNYPNPFNPETWIPYQLAKPADVALTIYDIQGRVVRDLDLGHQRAGTYHGRSRAAYWDGRNAVGESVASGVYFYTLKAGDFAATRKMLIRK